MATYLDTAAIRAMIDDTGQPMTVAGVTVNGLVDRVTVAVVDGPTGAPVLATDTTVSILTGSLPGLAVGVAITVDGVAMKVRQFMQVGDGAITEIMVATP